MAIVELIATSAFGLEAVVARELADLGFESRTTFHGGVCFRAEPRAICRANLWLRASDRVLVRVGSFPAADFGALFDQTFALPWEQWIVPDGKLLVRGRSHQSQLSSVPACQRIVNKAIVEKLLKAHRVATLPETGAPHVIEVALLKDTASLTLDTSGPGLHKRGYRTLVGQAPLKETLAAALVLLSVWRPNRPLLDPFCGTGTIPIEAALIGRNRAPGLSRSFAAEAWPCLDAAWWREAREEARDLVHPALAYRLIGTDIDPEALRLARHHARQAGVEQDVEFEQREFSDLSSSDEFGCLFANPPYGERLADARAVEALYESFPRVLRRLPTWSHFVLASHPRFERIVGRSATRRRKLFNGRIQCTYFQFLGPRPDRSDVSSPTCHAVEPVAGSREPLDAAEPRDMAMLRSETRPPPPAMELLAERSLVGLKTQDEMQPPNELESRNEDRLPSDEVPRSVSTSRASPHVPVFGGLTERATRQADDFRRCLANRVRHLARWATRRGISSYRVYESDLPEVPVTIDRYDDCLHVVERFRPHNRPPGAHADWLDLMIRVASEHLDVEPSRVFAHRWVERSGTCERLPEWGGDTGESIASEAGLEFIVQLDLAHETGLTLDYRAVRARIREASGGRTMLNLLPREWACTLAAVAGQARETVTVLDRHFRAELLRRNLRRHGADDRAHELIEADALEFLDSPQRRNFDLVLAGPWEQPRGGMSLDPFHARLPELLRWVRPGGTLLLLSRWRRWSVNEELLHEADATISIREITRQTVPEDFPRRIPHRSWQLQRKEDGGRAPPSFPSSPQAPA